MPMQAILIFPVPWRTSSPGFEPSTTSIPGLRPLMPDIARLDRKTGKWLRANDGWRAFDLECERPVCRRAPGLRDDLWSQPGVEGRSRRYRPDYRRGGRRPTSRAPTSRISAMHLALPRSGPNGSVQMENPPSTVCAAPDPSTNYPEGYLDAEWAGAMAPDATIDYVACADQGVTLGADLAAAYIIGDPAHVQRVSVLSSSYGDCEALPQSEASQFYVSLWQQAAAEGITVVVAAADTGADGCQYVYYYATDGLSVDNAASTPYNIAAGGTDFSDVFSGTEATVLVGDQRRQLSERAIVYPGDGLERKLRQPAGARPVWPELHQQLRAQRILHLCRATASRSRHWPTRPIFFPMPGAGA